MAETETKAKAIPADLVPTAMEIPSWSWLSRGRPGSVGRASERRRVGEGRLRPHDDRGLRSI